MSIADSFLSYNRQIFNRTDDSVIRIIDNKTMYYPSFKRICSQTG